MSAVDFILDTMFDDLPEATVHEAIRCLVNTLGVGVAASQIPLSRIIHNHATHQFSGTGATLWQNGRRVSAAGAALANGLTFADLQSEYDCIKDELPEDICRACVPGVCVRVSVCVSV